MKRLALAALVLAAACSTKLVRPKTITLCDRAGACAEVADDAARERLLSALHELFRSAKGRDFFVDSADPRTGAVKKQGISFFIQGGPIPGRSTIKSFGVPDVLFLDRERSESKLVLKNRATYVAVPVFCAEANATVSVTPEETRLATSAFCSWIGIGNGLFTFEWSVDRVDLARGTASGYWSMRGKGLPLVGGGSGYLVARFREEPAPAPAPKPEPPKPPRLELGVALSGAGEDGVFAPGETATLAVEIKNAGGGLATAVEAVLGGELAACLGGRKRLPGLPPGDAETLEFSCRLPARAKPAAADLRVELFHGKPRAKAAEESLRVELAGTPKAEAVAAAPVPAAAPAPAPVPAPVPAPAPVPKPAPPVVDAVEVVSRAPRLVLSAKLTDADGNLILEGGEKIALKVLVKNEGDALASRVEAVLSGEKTLVACLGQSRRAAGLPPGESVALDFECRLPEQVPSETVDLRVELFHGDPAVKAAGKLMKVGMTPAPETTEEVVSEIGVDDIPPRSKAGGPAINAALVVGLSRYREKAIPGVKYAARDAEVVARYLQNTGGVAPDNLKVLTDDTATKSDLEAYLEDWLPRRVAPDSTVFVYYAGHGAPDDLGKDAYLVPFEGHPDFPSKLFPLSRLYASLAKLPVKAVVVMLDSCFSGAEGRGLRRQGARPLIAAADLPGLDPKITVLAGASGTQVTSDLDKVEHGLFTYYLLRGLRGDADADRDGAITLGEIYPFVRREVSARASRELNRDQTPVMYGGSGPRAALPVVRR